MARKKIRNWIALTILFFSLVAIVVTGFGTGGGGGIGSLSGGSTPSGTELATVGGRPITTNDANNQFNQSFQQLRQRLPNVQIEEYLRQGGFEGAVEQLIAVEALSQYAQARGVVVTRQMVDRFILTSPEFQFARIGDNFDNTLFQRALQQANISEAQVRSEISRQLLQRQVLQPMQTGVAVPLGVAKAYAAVPLEQRSGLIGVVPVGGIQRALNPSDAEIAAYYQRYRDHFTVAERRVIKFALIGPEQVTIMPPTDAEIGAVYANTPRYQAGQIRSLLSAVFPNTPAGQAEANAFAQRVRGGTAFVAAAAATGRAEADVRAPNMRQRDFANRTSADVAAQAFRADRGAVVGPVRSSLGWHVVQVDSVSGGQPLDAVRADIVRELERRKRTAAIAALATHIEQQIGEGTTFEDAANAARLRIVTSPAITAQGAQANGQAWAEITPALRPVLAVAFDLDPDNPDPVVATIEENGRYALVGVDRTDPAAPPPLAEIRAQVRDQLVRRTALVRARQIADAIAARINGGMPAAQAFAQAGIPLPPPQPISTRRQNIMGGDAPAALQLFFRLRPGTAGVVAAPNSGGWMIAFPQQSVRGDEAAATQNAELVRGQLNLGAPEEIQRQILRAMELSIGVQRNAGAIRAERQRIGGTVGAGPAPR